MHVSSIYIQTVCRLSLEAATLTVTVSRRRPAAAPPGSSWTAVAVCGRLSSTGGPRRRTGEFQALYDKRRSNSASVAGQTAHAACMPALGRSVNQVRPQQALDRPTVRSWSGPAPDCRDMPSSEGALDATNLEITRRTQPEARCYSEAVMTVTGRSTIFSIATNGFASPMPPSATASISRRRSSSVSRFDLAAAMP
jgi:hypothetical protein